MASDEEFAAIIDAQSQRIAELEELLFAYSMVGQPTLTQEVETLRARVGELEQNAQKYMDCIRIKQNLYNASLERGHELEGHIAELEAQKKIIEWIGSCEDWMDKTNELEAERNRLAARVQTLERCCTEALAFTGIDSIHDQMTTEALTNALTPEWIDEGEHYLDRLHRQVENLKAERDRIHEWIRFWADLNDSDTMELATLRSIVWNLREKCRDYIKGGEATEQTDPKA